MIDDTGIGDVLVTRSHMLKGLNLLTLCTLNNKLQELLNNDRIN